MGDPDLDDHRVAFAIVRNSSSVDDLVKNIAKALADERRQTLLEAAAEANREALDECGAAPGSRAQLALEAVAATLRQRATRLERKRSKGRRS